jgi:ATPase subunit of ABC transporter with duplicated ATPase domains
VTVGGSVKIGYFSQHSLEVLDPNKTIFDEIHDRIPDATIGYVRNLAGAFQFSGDDTDKKIRALSGGEKTRLVMARMLLNPPNFLVLDEPTNHLDMATKDMLVEALSGFEGTMIFVSHDRQFLAALSNRVLEITAPVAGSTGGQEVRKYGGGYTEYVASSGHEAPGVRS